MFFDGHGDILTDVAEQLAKGVDIWEQYHKECYEKGGVNNGIFVNFTNPDSENQRADFEQINELSLPYFKNHQDFNIITKANDFKTDKFNLILGIEGLNCVELSEIDELYELGYRHLGITWNEKNKFAAGSIQTGGISELGKELVKKAESLGMIIDYAHLNEQSFKEVAAHATKPILFSHGNVKGLCNHPRNLSDEQLMMIKESNGVIGLAAMNFFINEQKQEASINDLIDHVKYLIDLIGVDHIGFGFDFCYYLSSHDSYNKVEGLNHIDDVKIMPELLKGLGLNQEEIDKICFKNMIRLVNDSL